MNLISFDAAFLHIGAVAIFDGVIVDARTFNADIRKLEKMERVNFIVDKQAAGVREFLDIYTRAMKVIIETPTNRDGTPWGPKSAAKGLLASGICFGVARGLGFYDIELIAAKSWGAGDRADWLARQLKCAPGVKLYDEDGKPKSVHEVDAAGMAKWYLG